jgi:hypothetical protein
MAPPERERRPVRIRGGRRQREGGVHLSEAFEIELHFARFPSSRCNTARKPSKNRSNTSAGNASAVG